MDDSRICRSETASADAATEFGVLLRENQSQLFGYLHSIVRDFNDADDLLQRTAMVLWRKFGEYDRSRGFLAWACGVARLESCNFLRSRGRERLYFSDSLNLLLIESTEQLGPDETDHRREALAKCLDKLRERDRELVRMCYAEDESRVAAVAGRLGRSSHSIHNTLRRIRRSLFECVRRSLAQGMHPDAHTASGPEVSS